MGSEKFNKRDRAKSFGYALQGLRTFFQTQPNAWIHLIIGIATIGAGVYFKLQKNDWLWIVLAITLVFVTELINTAIEFLSDVVSPEIHPQIKKVKDIAAAAVLVAAIAAVMIGLVVFLSEIGQLF